MMQKGNDMQNKEADWETTGGDPIPTTSLSISTSTSSNMNNNNNNNMLNTSMSSIRNNSSPFPSDNNNNSGTQKKIRLKCHHNSNIRAVAIDKGTSFRNLKQRLSADYGFEVNLRYEDPEGDLIVLSSQNDLNELVDSEVRNSVTVHVNNTESRGISQVLMSPTPVASAGHLHPLPSLPSLHHQDNGGSNNNNHNNNLSHAMIRSIGATGSSGLRRSSTRDQRTYWHSRPRQTEPIRWQRGEILGQGAYGTVFLGLNLDTGELMAVKQLDTTEVSEKELAALENELRMLIAGDRSDNNTESVLSHPNIVRYLGLERSKNTLSIFLEFVPGGSIRSLIDKFGALQEPLVRVYARQLLLGLEYLHRNSIAHRDIKGANVLITNEGVVKIADFGASKRINTNSTNTGGVKGTPLWMAPEVIKEQQTDKGWRRADVWSVGCTIIEMATGRPPWSQYSNPVTAMYHIACVETVPPFPDSISPQGHDFLRLCFERDPLKRPDVTRLLLHPFVTQLPATQVRHLSKSSFPQRPTTGGRRTGPGRPRSSQYLSRRDGLRTPMDHGTPQNRDNMDKFDLGHTSPTTQLLENEKMQHSRNNPELSRPSPLTPAREKLNKKPVLVINTEVNLERDQPESPPHQKTVVNNPYAKDAVLVPGLQIPNDESISMNNSAGNLDISWSPSSSVSSGFEMAQPPTPKNLVEAAINAAKMGEGIDLAKHGSPEHTLKEAELATEELRRKIQKHNINNNDGEVEEDIEGEEDDDDRQQQQQIQVNAEEKSILMGDPDELIRQQLELQQHNATDMVSSFKDLHSPSSTMVSPRAPSSPRLQVPLQHQQKQEMKKLIKAKEKVITPPRKQSSRKSGSNSSSTKKKKRKTPPKLPEETNNKHEGKQNVNNQPEQVVYTHEAQPKSTPRRLKTKLRKRRSKSQSPSAIHRVERQSIKEIEELRRNALSSLGKHKDEEETVSESGSEKKKHISPTQVREVKEKRSNRLPKYLEKKLSHAERKLKNDHSRRALSMDDGIRSSPEELAQTDNSKLKKVKNSGKVRLEAMKDTSHHHHHASNVVSNKPPHGKRPPNRHSNKRGADMNSGKHDYQVDGSKKPPLSPRTKKSANELKEERKRLVKSEPRRRSRRNSRDLGQKQISKRNQRKRAPRLELDNSIIGDSDELGSEFLTVSMKPVRMTSRSGRMKSPLGNIKTQRSRKMPFNKTPINADAIKSTRKKKNAALVQINTEEMERELDGIHGNIHTNDEDNIVDSSMRSAKSPELWVGERRKKSQLDRRGLATAIPKSNRQEFSSPANKPKTTKHSSSSEKRRMRLNSPEEDGSNNGRGSRNAGNVHHSNRDEDHHQQHEKRRPQTMALRLRSTGTPSNSSNRQHHSRASTSMAGSSNTSINGNDMLGEPLGALRGISVHPVRSSTPSFREKDRRRRRKKNDDFTEDHNEAVKKIQRWMRRRQQMLEPSLWGMQSSDDKRKRGAKLDLSDSLDDVDEAMKKQEQQIKQKRMNRRRRRSGSGSDKNTINGAEEKRDVDMSINTKEKKNIVDNNDSKFPSYARNDEPLSVKVMSGHRMRVVALHAACESNNRRSYVIASGSRDGTVRLWHPQSGEELRVLSHEHDQHVNNSSPTRRHSLDSSRGKRDSLSSSGGVRVSSRGGNTSYNNNGNGAPSKISCLKVNTQTRNELCSGAEDGSMWLWDMEAGQPTRIIAAHAAGITSLMIADMDVTRYVTASSDKTLKVWDLRSKRPLVHTLRGNTGPVNLLGIENEWGLAFSGSNDQSLRVWDIRTGRMKHNLQDHYGAVYSVGSNPSLFDGFVSGARDGSIKIWNKQATCRRTLRAHRGAVTHVSIQPVSRMDVFGKHVKPPYILSASTDQTARLWDSNKLTCSHILKGHKGPITVAKWASEQCAITGSADGTIRLWDARDGSCIKSLNGQSKDITDLECDSDTIVSTGKDGTLRMHGVF